MASPGLCASVTPDDKTRTKPPCTVFARSRHLSSSCVCAQSSPVPGFNSGKVVHSPRSIANGGSRFATVVHGMTGIDKRDGRTAKGRPGCDGCPDGREGRLLGSRGNTCG